MYNNFASPVSLVYDLNLNITSFTDFSSNFLFPNNYEILFLWTSSRNSLLQIRYLLVVILELNSISEVQYKGMMTDR